MEKLKSQKAHSTKPKAGPAYDEILLSQVVSEKKTIQITFLDGEFLIDGLRWHTPTCLGLKGGKVVNKASIKYWEVVEKQ